VQEMGIAAKAVIEATTNEPTAEMVRDLQGALRARYDVADWRDVVRPINDEMRALQRDALLAYILHQMRSHPESAHIDTPEKLFEYFLMDVKMDPCMETSRIRNALSSVQLFIERCLMNLETRVSPSAINPKQWQWMKRYRVWEANRKVYLYPENWLEPELRDDKSPFFKEAESELLQSDITEDSATNALLNYLSKLEEVAKLEPCGIYHIPADPGKRTGEVDHVVARTAGAHRKYYYRRHEYGYWTPWEPIKLDIEDNPVIPVVWKDRLLLFWLRILKQTPPIVLPPVPPTNTNLADRFTSVLIHSDLPEVEVKAVLCWSEYFDGKWQPTKTSDIDRPANLGSYGLSEPLNFDRSKLRLGSVESSDSLSINIFGVKRSAGFVMYNTHSSPVSREALSLVLSGSRRFLQTTGATLTIDYARSVWADTTDSIEVLHSDLEGSIVAPHHALQDNWNAPFFYTNSRHAFYVSTEYQPVRVIDYSPYGIPGGLVYPLNPKIPTLVLPTSPWFQMPAPWASGAPINVEPGVIDPAPMLRFVTEDAYIDKGFGTSAGVMYGGKEIGPSGLVNKTQVGF